MIIFLLLFFSINSYGDEETTFRINHYKASGKVAQRNITKAGKMLVQTYDLAGSLILEKLVMPSGLNESRCYLQDGTIIDSKSSEKFFACLLTVQSLTESQGGIKEGQPREKQSDSDLQFDRMGKGLK